MIRSLCVYCGSSLGGQAAYQVAANALGEALARSGIRLVFGGGQVGLMGVLADACLKAGGAVTGVIPQFLDRKEIIHPRVTDMRIVTTMHERKMMMAEEADGFIALPGGLGTMEELFEMWTWSQLGRHEKPLGLLNVNGYWKQLLAFLDHMQAEGFVEARHRAMLACEDSAEAVIEALNAHEYPGAIASLEGRG
ncbi:MAG: TIGR00730 family Rossman fold protein [Alphaproteobacteria bacterium]|nr:TIGR00730 family Rossman fold protein [Alphaproteobacteria bacterium]